MRRYFRSIFTLANTRAVEERGASRREHVVGNVNLLSWADYRRTFHDQPLETFLKKWVSKNVQNVPGLQSLEDEVIRLKSELLADAKATNISESELAEVCGDIGDYLTNEYEQIHDPEAGFRDH